MQRSSLDLGKGFKSILVRWPCPVFEQSHASAALAPSCNYEFHTPPVLLGWGRTSRSGALGVAGTPPPARVIRIAPFCAGAHAFPSHSVCNSSHADLFRVVALFLFFYCEFHEPAALEAWLFFASQCWPSVVLMQHLLKPLQPLPSSLPAPCSKQPLHSHTATRTVGMLVQWLQPRRPGLLPALDRKECISHVQRSNMQGFIISHIYRILHPQQNGISTEDRMGLHENKLIYTNESRGPSPEAKTEAEVVHCSQGLGLPRRKAIMAQVVTILQTL